MPTDIVRNEGSAARDHLANERTFLAWFRTALGLVGLGVLLERFDDTSTDAQLAGLCLIAFGALSLLYGLRRYLNISRHLVDGEFPVAKRGPIALSAGALVLVVAAAVYLLR